MPRVFRRDEIDRAQHFERAHRDVAKVADGSADKIKHLPEDDGGERRRQANTQREASAITKPRGEPTPFTRA